MLTRTWPRRLALAAALACTTLAAGAAGHRDPGQVFRLPDHYEFDASIAAAFRADPQGLHAVRMAFDYPAGSDRTFATWQVDVLDHKGVAVQRWLGEAPLAKGRGSARLSFNGRHASGPALAPGFYTLRLRSVPSVRTGTDAGKTLAQRASQSFALARDEMIDQRVDVVVGNVARPRMPAFKALPNGAQRTAVAAGSLPFTIYYGNLHSQTSHSDGGTPVASCGGSEVPQGGTLGPAEAFAMMDDQAGGDFLLASEHNHMYDGSTGTNANATPAQANNLFASGLAAAASYRSAHADFLALYGNECGVISNGGHLNILNPDVLPTWESNGSGQLLGGVQTTKSDYPALYATMKARGWIGQFNHPASSGQFLVNGTALGFDANGAEVMVAAEIRNTSAFSTSTTEGETGGGSFGTAFNILLERGYHVAPTSNQDNHCANWGIAGRNRTGVLLPNAAALNVGSFLDAMKARRVFATEDKNAQVVLTGNGQVMGQTIVNSGALALAANYASTSGGTAQRVQFFEGVPGRNGTVTQLFEGAGTYSFTPSAGEHFYYVLVTEADGDRLWSAPIWVSQGSGPPPPPADTTPPTVSASESGSSGTITLGASASDNVGVTRVEFYVDGVLKGSDASSPYAMTLDSTTLSDGTHSLTAKAFDAAGLSTTSTAVSFAVNNAPPPPPTQFNEVESNGTVAAANVVAHSFTKIVGTMGNSTDKDYFKLSLAANETVKVDMAGGPAGADYDLYLVNASDAALKSSTGGTVTETLSYTNGASAATVYAKVISYSGSSATAAYNLTLTYTAAPTGGVELLLNPGFESGNTTWTATSGVIDNSGSQAARTGSWKAWLNGYGSAHTDSVRQTVAIPASAAGTLSFWLKVASDETSTTTAYDTLKVQVRNGSGTVLATLATYSNLNKGSSYVQKSFNLAAYRGQTIQLYFEGIEGSTTATSFLVDDVSLK